MDETGDVKKGTATPGVQRQYTGTAGRIENGQVAVFWLCRPARARADRPRAVPAEVLDRGPGPVPEAAVPDDAAFATKPELARRCSTGRSSRGAGRLGDRR